MSLAQAASAQGRIVGALVLRETRAKFGQTQLGYLWALIGPALWILTFYIAMSIRGRGSPSGMDYLSFLVTGFGTYHLFQKVADALAGSIGGNRSLLVFPHVVPMDVFIARTSLNVATSVVVNTVLLLVSMPFTGHVPHIQDPLGVIYGASCAIIMGFGFGLTLGAISNYTVAVDKVKVIIVRPLFWTSGLFFTANDLPSGVRDILLYNPVLHAVEFVRGGWFREYDARYADPLYLSLWTVGLLLLGLGCERAARPRTES